MTDEEIEARMEARLAQRLTERRLEALRRANPRVDWDLLDRFACAQD